MSMMAMLWAAAGDQYLDRLIRINSNEMGFIGILNALLALLFPFWPWEPFLLYPLVLEFYARQAKHRAEVPRRELTQKLVLVVTVFAAVFSGLGHSLGLIQALDTLLLGGDGICNALPAPDGGHVWCVTMSLHILLMVIMGYYFVYVAASPERLLPGGANYTKVFYERAALFFVVGGISQILPYLGQMVLDPSRIGSVLSSPGFYSGRSVTPGATEFLEPVVWISYGIYAAIQAAGAEDPAQYTEIV